MTTFMPEDTAADVLTYLLLGGRPLELVIFSEAPTRAGKATDGVEAAARQPITLGTVMDATGARIEQVLATSDVIFTGMLVPSSGIDGCALAYADTHEIKLVDYGWRPPRSFAAGDDFVVYAREVVVFTTYV